MIIYSNIFLLKLSIEILFITILCCENRLKKEKYQQKKMRNQKQIVLEGLIARSRKNQRFISILVSFEFLRISYFRYVPLTIVQVQVTICSNIYS